jgi:hypothetical protein
VPAEMVPKWLSYFRTEQPALAFKCPVKRKSKKRIRKKSGFLLQGSF